MSGPCQAHSGSPVHDRSRPLRMTPPLCCRPCPSHPHPYPVSSRHLAKGRALPGVRLIQIARTSGISVTFPVRRGPSRTRRIRHGWSLLTASFMDYALPRAEDVPFLRFETRNVPSTTNPLGIKGAGEAGSIGSCPAVMNALVDALDRACGVRDIDMPATPHAVFRG